MLEDLNDDALLIVLQWVAQLDIVTAVVAVPLVCRRWRRLLQHVCFKDSFGRVDGHKGSVSCSLPVVVQRVGSVQSLSLSRFRRVTSGCLVEAIGGQ